MRIFLDANVLFSASRRESNLALLLRRVSKTAQIVTSDLASLEASRNIAIKRPNWSSGLDEVMSLAEIVPSVTFPLPVELDEKDTPLLCAAIRASCQYFVTGDKRDFGHLFDQSVAGVTIITPLRLAEILLDAEKV